MQINNYPSFVIVGQPNKGKSSIVSTLAYNDLVKVSHRAGETKVTQAHALKIDGDILYKIYDTPGFQEAREVLQYLKENYTEGMEKSVVLKKFVDNFKDSKRYSDEVELLSPIVNGGAIIYIVDGSTPLTKRYAPEMEILSWSESPSMVFINRTKEDEYYLQEWRKELKKYFVVIREYNPMKANLEEKIKFLQSFALLNQEWEENIQRAIKAIKNNFEMRIINTVKEISKNSYESIMYKESYKPLIKNKISKDDEKILENRYKQKIRVLEKDSHKKVQKIWGHYQLKSDIDALNLQQKDIFSKEASSDGLLKKSIALASTIAGGAIAGTATATVMAPTGVLDFGTTALISTTIATAGGGLSGFVGSMYGYNNLINKTFIGNLIIGKSLQMGPIKNENFIFILSARAIKHALTLIKKSHADRKDVYIAYDNLSAEKLFNANERKILVKIHHGFIKNKNREENQKDYEELILEVIKTQL